MAAPRATITIMEDNMPLVQTWVNALKKVNVFVGVPDENDHRYKLTGGEEEGVEQGESNIGNVALANMMENGAPSHNVPSRPFMKPAMEELKGEVRARLQIAATYLYQKKNDRARQALNGIGIKLVAKMRRNLESNTSPPLQPNTIKKRKSRGIMRTNTLMETKQLWNALGYRVRGV